MLLFSSSKWKVPSFENKGHSQWKAIWWQSSVSIDFKNHRNIFLNHYIHRILTVANVFAEEFICSFDMRWYPFSTQKCNVEISLNGNTNKFIVLENQKLLNLAEKDLSMWTIEEIKFNPEVIIVFIRIMIRWRLQRFI